MDGSLALFCRVMKHALGLGVMLGLVLLVTGCDGEDQNGTPTRTDHSTEAGVRPEGQRSATRGQPNEGSRPPSRGSQSIPGMNADAVAAIFLKPGLECWEPVERGVLYACSGEENHDLPLLYEGKITGRGIDLVSTVEARIYRSGSKDFGLSSQPFFGLLSTQLEYRGADKERAYEFVNRNLNSTRANTTIGAAEWTITTSHDRKILLVAPGSRRGTGEVVGT